MVTAETAVVLPSLVAVLALLVWGLAVGAMQLRCLAAARSASLATARGEDVAVVRAQVRRAAGPAASLSLSRTATEVRAVVRSSVGGGLLPRRTVTATAYAVPEPEPEPGAAEPQPPPVPVGAADP